MDLLSRYSSCGGELCSGAGTSTDLPFFLLVVHYWCKVHILYYQATCVVVGIYAVFVLLVVLFPCRLF